MIDSRELSDLLPPAKLRAQKFLAACKAVGIDILIYCTYRDGETQNKLYAQGRTTPGKIVTFARAGESTHNFRLAFDFVPTIGGKAMWNDAALYKRCGAIAESVGLSWAGRWTGPLRETAHCEYTAGLTLQDIQAGKRPK